MLWRFSEQPLPYGRGSEATLSACRIPSRDRQGAVFAVLCFFTTGVLAAQTLAVFPPSVNLSTPESRQQLIAEATLDNHQEDWTAKVKWSSSNPQVATVDAHGIVKPVSDGDALSHPFVERLIGTTHREFLDHLLFWNARDLERKLAEFQAYYNAARCHASLEGARR